MKRYLFTFTALAMSLTSGAFAPSLRASDWDEKTIITTSQPVTVPSKTLPAGRYVLKLDEGNLGRNVVFIYNGDETHLITTVLATPAYRLVPSDKTELTFYESPAGQPAALRTWFYPGENFGFEFLQTPAESASESPASGH
jgi:hypothetical protein